METNSAATAIEKKAKSFAKRTLANLKSGTSERSTQSNNGPAFSPGRDASAVENHKKVLETPMWDDFINAETQ